jgi:hypothetical protein
MNIEIQWYSSLNAQILVSQRLNITVLKQLILTIEAPQSTGLIVYGPQFSALPLI